jgi:tetratricopeptide (TPR) repeat protein
MAFFGIIAVVVGSTPFVWSLPATSLVAQATNVEDAYSQGIQKLDLKDFQGAIASFNQVIEAKPRHAEGYLYRGLARQGTGDFMGALAPTFRTLKCHNLLHLRAEEPDSSDQVDSLSGAVVQK